ncbi:DUF1345 domain-containing protein [Acinetobacter sp. ANC 3813]|uniref:DUF1345 domain-containing protein n=1 Tax=Acinetobacter sp. ANC 3813 TaxID=1977873 RepID=UPI000A337B2E|nr:DUF1345 domain-containing protein [Acinetobacter sp. ANC 3813]OTG90102.1 hypothetical protein B9T34_09765 [Acinetobacter sp. ANC 3813]
MNFQPFSRIKAGLQYRPYFFISFAATLILYSALRSFSAWPWSTCLLISWNAAVSCYLIFTMLRLWRADHSHILERAQQQDASKWLILFLVFITLVMCFIAIVVEVNLPQHNPHLRFAHLALSFLTILCAWLFMHTVFAIHYAHDFYLAVEESKEGGLEFPKTPQPTYPDFLYFSYVIGTSAQTADVSITSRAMRTLNILHILLAYGFNTTILAISINVAAGFI